MGSDIVSASKDGVRRSIEQQRPSASRGSGAGGISSANAAANSKVINYNKKALVEIASLESEVNSGNLNATAKYALKKRIATLKAAEKKENLTRERFEQLFK